MKDTIHAIVQDIHTKKVVVMGAGESGVGAAILAQKKGAQVWVSDYGKIKEKYQKVLDIYSIPYEEGKHTKEKFFDADCIVKSPGIPQKVPFVKELKKRGKLIVSEIEFASWFTDAFILAITGSNGKTTTTSLLFHILKANGVNAAIGGNIGNSFAYLVANKAYDYYVLEISSFQLEDTFLFRPNVAILTNITPDHLDRYEYQLENYAKTKFAIGKNQEEEDVFIYCSDDLVTLGMLDNQNIQANRLAFGLKETKNSNIWFDESKGLIKSNHPKLNISTKELQVKGRHNLYNAMAAIGAAKCLSLTNAAIESALGGFAPIPHRLEPVKTVNGVIYINDSKATNVEAVWYALDSIQTSIVWIVGGVDKGNDYTSLLELVKKKVRVLITLGKYKEKLIANFASLVDEIEEAMSMEEAVDKAYKRAHSGECVLLSPACASFDLFQNYEHRGNEFKRFVGGFDA